jgi:hypothetical protein
MHLPVYWPSHQFLQSVPICRLSSVPSEGGILPRNLGLKRKLNLIYAHDRSFFASPSPFYVLCYPVKTVVPCACSIVVFGAGLLLWSGKFEY